MGLNEKQKEAVDHFSGPCMVLAGPGSGKTTVISERIRKLIFDHGVDPSQILVITFTRAAAEEMKKRFFKLTRSGGKDGGNGGGKDGGRAAEVTFGTFHSVFFQMLRMTYGFRRENLPGESEKAEILKESIRSCVKPSEDFRVNREDLRILLSEISSVKNNGTDPGKCQSAVPKIDFPKVFRAFSEKMREKRYLDFDDMLLMTYELLSSRPEILSFYRERYSFLLIDEFQDINRIQYEIVKLLAGERKNLFIVGDDDQSIYGFRGAAPGIMLKFPEEMKPCKIVALSENYRSGAEIIKTSMKLISKNKARYRKKMSAGRDFSGRVSLRRYGDEDQETDAIVKEIGKLRDQGVPLHEIAVLSRTNNGNLLLAQKLLSRRIPYYMKERTENIFSHFIAEPLFACLNFAIGSPKRKYFLKFMNTPNRYFRREDLKVGSVLQQEDRKTGSVLQQGDRQSGSFLQQGDRKTENFLQRENPEGGRNFRADTFSEQENEITVSLSALEKYYRQDPERKFLGERTAFLSYQLRLLASLKNPYAMVNYFRKGMGYDGYVSEYAERKNADEKELLFRLDLIQDTAKPFRTVAEWYGYIAEYSRNLEQEKGKTETVSGKVMLSTYHGSKEVGS